MVLCMIVAATLVMPVQASDDQSIIVKVSGPTVVGIGGSNLINVTVAGGPAGSTNGTYTCTATMTGYAATNATLVNTGSSSSLTGRFTFNLTTPKVAGSLTIHISASSENLNGTVTTYNNATTFGVQVVNPIVFTVSIKNTGNMTVTNIPVYFWVDYVDNSSVPVHIANVTIAPQSTQVVSYNWTTNNLGSGSHVLRAEIDPKATFVQFAGGAKVMTTTFYYNQSDYGTTNALLYVALAVLAFLVFIMYRRPVPRKKK